MQQFLILAAINTLFVLQLSAYHRMALHSFSIRKEMARYLTSCSFGVSGLRCQANV